MENNLSELVNIAKKKFKTMNEFTFSQIVFFAFTQSHQSEEDSLTNQHHHGKKFGISDMVLYFDDRADIYEFKYQPICRNNKDINKILNKAKNQIEKQYLNVIKSYIENDKSLKTIKQIKQIPLLLYKNSTEGNYICKIGEVSLDTINTKEETNIKLNDNIGDEYEEVSEEENNIKEENEVIKLDNNERKKDYVKKLKNSFKNSEEIVNFILKNYKNINTIDENEFIKQWMSGKHPFGIGKITASKIYQLLTSNKSVKKGGFVDNDINNISNITYKSNELEYVLKKRIKDEGLNKVEVLHTYKSYETYSLTHISFNILLNKINTSHKNNNYTLLPYADEDHFIGIIFERLNPHSLIASIFDSDIVNIDSYSYMRFINKFRDYAIEKGMYLDYRIIDVEQQKYIDNCGVEVIENYIGYLKGENLLNRNINQINAIELHRKINRLYDIYSVISNSESMREINYKLEDLEINEDWSNLEMIDEQKEEKEDKYERKNKKSIPKEYFNKK
jgi:hypothetical protein